MAVKAYLKNASVSPRKAQVLAALVRGRSVSDALTILEHTPRRSALLVKKTIASARANAEHNHGYRPDTLMISEISVTPGARSRRFRPIAHGQANPFERKTSNIRVMVDGVKREVKKPATSAKKETK